MITPPYLKKGDKIGIVAPARKISKEEIQPAVEVFENWGLKPVFGKNLFGADNQYSGNDEQRTDDLQKMLDDPSVRAVISARGGYGSLRIIDDLDFKKFEANPKWIIGYSDITVLHSHIHQNLGIETLHAVMPAGFKKPVRHPDSTLMAGGDDESVEAMRKCLFGEKISYVMPSHPLNRKGKAEGVIVGGNLSLLYALKGSKSDISTSGKILFIEDVDEYLYHIDRMIISLKRAGKLSQLAGLIVGGMSDMKDNKIPFGKTAEEIIIEAVSEFGYPVCFDFPAGHQDKNLALPLGRRAKLDVGGNASLYF